MKTESCLLYFKAAGLCVFLIFSLVFSMLAGTEKIPAGDFFPALINYNPEDIYSVILFKIRLPRTLTAAVCGLLLGGTGAILQGFFRNPLADSGVLGLSSGAALGGVIGSTLISTSIGQYTFGGISTISLSAFAGALFCAIILLFFSRSGRKGNGTTLILAGTAISAIFTGLTSYILLLNTRELYKMFMWTLGSFNGKGWNDFFFILPAAFAALGIMVFLSFRLDILISGEEKAVSLGLNLKTTTYLVLIAGSLGTAAAVCGGGIIGFIGLTAPHITRRIFSSRHRILVPLSMITGSILILVSDSLSRIIAPPSEIPLGIITSLTGAPVFIWILLSYQRKDKYGN